MDTEFNDSNEIAPSIPKEKCRYCASEILPEAKICTVCNQFKSRFRNHFRIDHLGILITLVMMTFAYYNLRVASENLKETRQKRIEATAALERVELAEKKVEKLKSDLSTILSGTVELLFLQNAGQNLNPNPYVERIIKRLNEFLLIAFPEEEKRVKFTDELREYKQKYAPRD